MARKDQRRRAAATDRFWDRLIDGPRAQASGVDEVDERSAVMMRRLNALNDAPGLEAARARIWSRLGYAGGRFETSALPELTPLGQIQPPSANGRVPPPAGKPRMGFLSADRHRRRWGGGQAAAAALLVLVLASALVVSRQRTGPHAMTIEAPTASSELEFMWQTGGGPDPLDQPSGLAIDLAGNLWVGDGRNARFQIFAPDGTLRETWGTAGSGEGELDLFGYIRNWGRGDIAFDAAGNMYVADTGNHRIQMFAPDRTFLLAWGSEGEGDGQFRTPTRIAVAPDGAVYVGDEARNDVQKFGPDGTFRGVFGRVELEDGKPFMGSAVAVAADGSVWIVEDGKPRVAHFSPEGELLDDWGVSGSQDGQLNGPSDLALDDQGRVYVADTGNHRIQVFTADGRFLAAIGGRNTPGLLSLPNSIAVSSDGVVYVSDDLELHAFRAHIPPGMELLP